MVKEQLRDCLVNRDYDTIVHLAGTTTRVLSFLTALTYDDDRLISWRAIEAIGLAAARIADDDPEPVRVHLRRMQWLLNDESGGIGWRLPEAMGEIIYNRPLVFSEFVSIVITLFDLEEEDVAKFRPGILWAIGLAAARIADDDPEPVRVHLRRMQWLLNDESGGIGWRLPEAMGEIIYNRPLVFSEFVSIVITLFDLEEEDVIKFRPGILWAIGRIAQVMPDIDRELALPWIIPCLDDPDPQTRGMAVWCLGHLDAVEQLSDRDTFLRDDSPVELYVDGQLTSTSVATLTQAALRSESLNK